jgi:hypothetical protein
MPLIQHQKIYISQGNNMLRKGNKNKIKILGKNILENNENISTAYIICTGIR